MGVKAELLRCLVLALLNESDLKKKKKKRHQQLSVQELGLDKWSENRITPDKKAAQTHL